MTTKNNSIISFFLIFLFLCVPNLVSQTPESKINNGLLLERQGKVEEAISLYSGYLEKNPTDVNAALKLFNLLLRTKQYENIITEYTKLNNEMKRRKDLAAMLARAYLQTGKKNKSVKVIRDIIINEGETENSFSFSGNLLLSLGLVEEAKKVFLEGRRKYAKNPFARELYLCYKILNDYPNAVVELLLYYRNIKGAKEWVRRELITLTKKDNAVLRELERQAENNGDIKKLTGEILLATGKIKKAKKYLIQSLDAPSLLTYASLCFDEGYYREAEESLSKILTLAPNLPEKEKALLLQAHTYEQLKQYDNSLKSLDEILKTGITLKDTARIEKSRILLFRKKEFKKSLHTIEPMLAKTENLNHNIILLVAISGYIKTGNLKKAKEILKNSTLPFSYYLTAEILFLEESYEESKTDYLKAVSRGLDKDYANNALERIMLIETLTEKQNLLSTISNIEKMAYEEKFDDAINLVNASFDSFSDKQDRSILLFFKSKIYALMGKENEAISSYVSIFEENSESPIASKSLYKAALLYKTKVKDNKMSKKWFEKIIFEYPESIEAELSRGELEALGKLKQ